MNISLDDWNNFRKRDYLAMLKSSAVRASPDDIERYRWCVDMPPLRRGEALNLPWENIDWQRHRLIIVANGEWKPKDKDSRTIPIVPALFSLLTEAFEMARDGQQNVIDRTINAKNVFRDFDVLCTRGAVTRWKKPIHTLRKTCLTRWAREFPQHVVKEWAGHASEETTSQFYLKVGEGDYFRAAGIAPAAPTIAPIIEESQKSVP